MAPIVKLNLRDNKFLIKYSSICDYIDGCILIKGAIPIVGQGAYAAATAADKNNKQVIFKKCALFADGMKEIFNTQEDNPKDLDVVMPMYNLIEYSNGFSRTPGSL